MKIRISKKSIAHFPANIQAAIKEIKRQYRTASFTYNEKNVGDKFYFAEGAKVRCFYGEEEARINMVTMDTVGSNDCHAIGSTITPKAGTTILSTEYFQGKYYLEIYNYDQKLTSVPSAPERASLTKSKQAPTEKEIEVNTISKVQTVFSQDITTGQFELIPPEGRQLSLFNI